MKPVECLADFCGRRDHSYPVNYSAWLLDDGRVFMQGDWDFIPYESLPEETAGVIVSLEAFEKYHDAEKGETYPSKEPREFMPATRDCSMWNEPKEVTETRKEQRK